MNAYQIQAVESAGEQTTVQEAAGDCEVTTTNDVWSGPHLEYDKYGQLTGAKYFRCRDCGREVHESIDKEQVTHRSGCENGR
ncbi:hypothetical protein SAMN05421809_3045 [Natronorubrum daqingense]|uniref:DUF8118 domain-containing protein n=1 Tax=Natronorubrum daqingense TaxID=588898 RepID=A0A1N7F668_9EURY|nr:hypothetical protein BB347_13640 [Natronorubrum daqingense]SIR95858.1 hypothetical protein SAMN05421809_3045 [Natronorubrum daqingense]